MMIMSLSLSRQEGVTVEILNIIYKLLQIVLLKPEAEEVELEVRKETLLLPLILQVIPIKLQI